MTVAYQIINPCHSELLRVGPIQPAWISVCTLSCQEICSGLERVGVTAVSREGPPCAPGELQGEGDVIPQVLVLCTPSHFRATQCSLGMITKPYGQANATQISACWQNESLLILSPFPPSAWERG